MALPSLIRLRNKASEALRDASSPGRFGESGHSVDGDLNHLVNSALLCRIDHPSPPEPPADQKVAISDGQNTANEGLQHRPHDSPMTHYSASERSIALTNFGPSPPSSGSWATSSTMVNSADVFNYGPSTFIPTHGAVPPPPPFLPEVHPESWSINPRHGELPSTPQQRRSLKRSREGPRSQHDSVGPLESQPMSIPLTFPPVLPNPWLLSTPVHGSFQGPVHYVGAEPFGWSNQTQSSSALARPPETRAINEATHITSDTPEAANSAYHYIIAHSIHGSLPFPVLPDFHGTASETSGAPLPGTRFAGAGPTLPTSDSHPGNAADVVSVSVAGSSGMSELDELEGDGFDFGQYVNQLANGYFAMDED